MKAQTMKPLNTKLILTALIVFMANLAFAQKSFFRYDTSQSKNQAKQPSKQLPFQAHVSFKDSLDQRFYLAIHNPDKRNLTIQLQGPFGSVYSHKTADSAYLQAFNFTTAEDGHYRLKISNGRNKYQKTISITTDTQTIRRTTLN